ncbi:hypothetical protein D0Y65_038990 [Glycine soja]|uniref:SWIM-type domain-containing protein n=1 Tax=Glycine soja TaxID=3848 RepID=A0A445H854_GLYSO|nr:hypothetical protein D0Y65_038990 [Glycine soja]
MTTGRFRLNSIFLNGDATDPGVHVSMYVSCPVSVFHKVLWKREALQAFRLLRDNNFWKPIHLRRSGLKLSHLTFLLFVETSMDLVEVSPFVFVGGGRVHEESLLNVVERWKCLLFAILSICVEVLGSTRPTKEQTVRLRTHHGWMLIYKPSTMYVNGEIVEEEWGWDVDTMSYIDLTKIKSHDVEAWKDLERLNPAAWTRSAFKGMEKFVVNLKQQTCSCRKWELTGIPCTHSIACMWINVMLPPVMRRAPGKPKKTRNKRNDESTKRSNPPRQSKLVVCKKCGKIGHNKRTCKGKTSADRIIPKWGNKNLKRQATCPTTIVTKKQKNASNTSQTTSAGNQGVHDVTSGASTLHKHTMRLWASEVYDEELLSMPRFMDDTQTLGFRDDTKSFTRTTRQQRRQGTHKQHWVVASMTTRTKSQNVLGLGISGMWLLGFLSQ